MAAVAGALKVRLEKSRHYQLGEINTLPTLQTIGGSLRLVQIAMLVWVLVCFIAGGIRFVFIA
jgi:cobalamin biosynthesis protein CobD/CbiB